MDAFDWGGCYDVGGLASTSLHAGARDALGCRAIGDLFDVGLLSGVLRRGNSRRAARNKGTCSVVGRSKASLIFRPPCNSSVPQCDLHVSVVVVCSSISPPRRRGNTETRSETESSHHEPLVEVAPGSPLATARDSVMKVASTRPVLLQSPTPRPTQ